MKKLLMQYYFWLSVILFTGYGQLYAHEDADTACLEDIIKQDQDNFYAASISNDVALINYTTLHFEKQQETIELSQNENEEEELSIHGISFFKKFAAINNYLVDYYPQSSYYFYQNLAKRQSWDRPFYALSSRQYILFRVIRI